MKETQRIEFLNRNFTVGWLDIFFPYHMKTIVMKNPLDNSEDKINTTLRFYARRKAFLLWLHH